jgi:hypothetical protein
MAGLQTDSNSKKFYQQSDIELDQWVLKDDRERPINEGEYAGRNYKVYKKTEHHDDFLWKFLRGLRAFAATFFSFGFALFSKKVQLWWIQAVTGDEVFKIKVLTKLNTTDTKTQNIQQQNIQNGNTTNSQGQTTVSIGHKPSSETVATNIAHFQGYELPPERKFPPLLNDKTPTEKLASILTLKPQDPRLNEVRNLLNIKEGDPEYHRTDFRESPLLKWPAHSSGRIHYLTGVNNHSEIDTLVLERIELLNDSFQLRDRLTALGDHPALEELQMQDIEASWDQSPLKILFQSDEEIREMNIKTLTALSPRQMHFLLMRKFPESSDNKLEINSEEEFNKLSLQQLRLLDKKSLNQFVPKFLGNAIQLFTEKQKDELEVSKLNAEQFRSIYTKATRMIKLQPDEVFDSLNSGFFDFNTAVHVTKEQIKGIDFTKIDCEKAGGIKVFSYMFGQDNKIQELNKTNLQHLIPFVGYYLGHLKPEQIQGIDFTDNHITQDHFIRICGMHLDKVTGRGVPHLTKDQLVTCLNRKFFIEHDLLSTSKVASYITIDQIKAIDDFTQIDCKKVGGYNVLAPMLSPETKLHQLDKKNLQHLITFISGYYLGKLKPEQIRDIDFSDVRIEKDHFLRICGMHLDKEIGRGVPHLTKDQIVTCLNRKFFVENDSLSRSKVASYITSDQIKEIDFTKIDCKKVGEYNVIAPMFSNENNIHELDKKNLQHLIPFISNYSLGNLKDKQIKDIDFSDEKITQEHLKRICAMHLEINKGKGRGVSSLTPEQIEVCLKRSLFKEQNTSTYSDISSHVTNGQLIKIEFTEIDCEKAGGYGVFAPMFSNEPNNIHQLDKKNLQHLLPFISYYALGNLKPEQIKDIDFSDEKITQAHLKGICALHLEINKGKGRGVSSLTPEQIEVCLKRSLFKEQNTLTYSDISPHVTNGQLIKIEFTKIDCEKAGGYSVFAPMFSNEPNNIHQLDKKNLQHLLPFISYYALGNLKDEQIKDIDFSDKHITQEKFYGICAMHLEINKGKGRGVGSLSPDQVKLCVERGFFDLNSMDFLEEKQLSKFNFGILPPKDGLRVIIINNQKK